MQNLGKLNDYLEKIDKVISEGKYKDDWKSLAKHDVPTWYRDGKLGIFVHWGVYTVPEFSDEWYPRRMYLKDQPRRGLDCFQHHIDTYGEHKDFGYKDLIPMFKAEKFDASEWVSLFKEAGAKFVMPVAEHHDGFQMYDSELSDWNAVKMGPKRDLIAEWKEEILKQDLVFTASSHRIEHYFFFEGGREFDSDLKDLSYGDLYWPAATKEEWNTKDGVVVDELFMKDWLARTCEIVDKYQPQIIFFDWWIQVEPLKPYLKKFMAYYYNRALEWGKEVTVNYKHDAFIHTSAVKDIERGQLTDVSPFFWQNDTSVAKHSWSYTHGNEYKHPNDIISDLVDVVAKNGALLLNVDPKADGSVPEETAFILKELGNWMKINGEAIYDTNVFRIYGEGPTKTQQGHFTDTKRSNYTSEDLRFTMNANSMYVTCLKWPQDGVVRIKSLARNGGEFSGFVKKARILGQDKDCEFAVCDDYLTVIGGKIDTEYPVCIKLDVE